MSTTSSCDLLGVRLPDCEIARDNLLAGGGSADAAPADRKDSNGALEEAKEATDTVDGRRAMQCSDDTSVKSVGQMSTNYRLRNARILQHIFVPCSRFVSYSTTLSASIHYLPSVSLLAVSAPSISTGLGFRSTGGGAGVASDVRDDCEVEGPF